MISNLENIRKKWLVRNDGKIINNDGGPGSGNWGHKGRPGEVGGSQKNPEAAKWHRYVDAKTGKYTSFAKEKKKAATLHQPNANELKKLPKDSMILAGQNVYKKLDDTKWYDVYTGEVIGAFTLNKDFLWGKDIKVAIPASGEPVINELVHKEGSIISTKKASDKKKEEEKPENKPEEQQTDLPDDPFGEEDLEPEDNASEQAYDLGNGFTLMVQESSDGGYDYTLLKNGEDADGGVYAPSEDMSISDAAKNIMGSLGVDPKNAKKVHIDPIDPDANAAQSNENAPEPSEAIQAAAPVEAPQEVAPPAENAEEENSEPENSKEKTYSVEAMKEASGGKVFSEEGYSQERVAKAKKYSAKASVKALYPELKKAWSNYTEDEKAGLFKYTQGPYFVNEPLTKRKYAGYKVGTTEAIKNITSAIDSAEIPQDCIMYHGIGWGGFCAMFNLPKQHLSDSTLDSLVGSVGRNDAFLSCGSSTGKGFTHQPVTMDVFVPKGSKGVWVEPFSAYGNWTHSAYWDGNMPDNYDPSKENETILQRGGMYKLTGYYYKSGRLHAVCELVGQDTTKMTQEEWEKYV